MTNAKNYQSHTVAKLTKKCQLYTMFLITSNTKTANAHGTTLCLKKTSHFVVRSNFNKY